MIIVDHALQERQHQGRPIRVGLIGAGYMGRGIALQILTAVPGMTVTAIYNRHAEHARQAYINAGIDRISEAQTSHQIDQAHRSGEYAITENALAVCEAECIDAIIEVTGTIHFAAEVVLKAISAGKHIVLMNAELDATLGPILKVYADRAGVVLTTSDGDQPGVIMNLLRWVKSIGFKPVLAGNMKGLQDPYRTPETQKAYAAQYKQKPHMVTSFADGTKVSMEMAVVANATGFRVGQRGMYGPRCKHVNDAADLFPADKMLATGLVDYILGAEPAPGVFVIGHNENPIQRQYLTYYKMGEGPFYVFYIPYHLCHLEAPLSVARAVIFGDAVASPLGGPVCEVVAAAKRDLQAGETIDGLGEFCSYGVLENIDVCRAENLLSQGLAQGGRLKKDIPKDQILTFEDVEFPPDRIGDRLKSEQDMHFSNFSTL